MDARFHIEIDLLADIDRPILRAFEGARNKGLICVGMTGSGESPMLELCDYLLQVPSTDTPKIQVGHLVLGHILCGLVENALFEAPAG